MEAGTSRQIEVQLINPPRFRQLDHPVDSAMALVSAHGPVTPFISINIKRVEGIQTLLLPLLNRLLGIRTPNASMTPLEFFNFDDLKESKITLQIFHSNQHHVDEPPRSYELKKIVLETLSITALLSSFELTSLSQPWTIHIPIKDLINHGDKDKHDADPIPRGPTSAGSRIIVLLTLDLTVDNATFVSIPIGRSSIDAFPILCKLIRLFRPSPSSLTKDQRSRLNRQSPQTISLSAVVSPLINDDDSSDKCTSQLIIDANIAPSSLSWLDSEPKIDLISSDLNSIVDSNNSSGSSGDGSTEHKPSNPPNALAVSLDADQATKTVVTGALQDLMMSRVPRHMLRSLRHCYPSRWLYDPPSRPQGNFVCLVSNLIDQATLLLQSETMAEYMSISAPIAVRADQMNEESIPSDQRFLGYLAALARSCHHYAAILRGSLAGKSRASGMLPGASEEVWGVLIEAVNETSDGFYCCLLLLSKSVQQCYYSSPLSIRDIMDITVDEWALDYLEKCIDLEGPSDTQETTAPNIPSQDSGGFTPQLIVDPDRFLWRSPAAFQPSTCHLVNALYQPVATGAIMPASGLMLTAFCDYRPPTPSDHHQPSSHQEDQPFRWMKCDRIHESDASHSSHMKAIFLRPIVQVGFRHATTAAIERRLQLLLEQSLLMTTPEYDDLITTPVNQAHRPKEEDNNLFSGTDYLKLSTIHEPFPPPQACTASFLLSVQAHEGSDLTSVLTSIIELPWVVGEVETIAGRLMQYIVEGKDLKSIKGKPLLGHTVQRYFISTSARSRRSGLSEASASSGILIRVARVIKRSVM